LLSARREAAEICPNAIVTQQTPLLASFGYPVARSSTSSRLANSSPKSPEHISGEPGGDPLRQHQQ
jgi:hypothetical protein